MDMGKFPYELENLPCGEYDRIIAWKRFMDKRQPNEVQENKKIADFTHLVNQRTKK